MDSLDSDSRHKMQSEAKACDMGIEVLLAAGVCVCVWETSNIQLGYPGFCVMASVDMVGSCGRWFATCSDILGRVQIEARCGSQAGVVMRCARLAMNKVNESRVGTWC